MAQQLKIASPTTDNEGNGYKIVGGKLWYLPLDLANVKLTN